MLQTKSQETLFPSAKILIVDDEQGNIHVLKRMLKAAGYQNITSTTDSRTTFDLYKTLHPDLVLLDIKMPGFNGFDVMQGLSGIEKEGYLPILVLTAQLDSDTKLKALKAGAKDFVNKPFNIEEMLVRIENLLEVRMLHNSVHFEKRNLEEQIRERTQALQQYQIEIIHRLARAAEYRDNETGMHVIRMSKLCERLARGVGMQQKECEILRHASPMHDIGKIGIPDHILLKSGKLTPEEWKVMQTHAEIGALILSGSNSDLLQMAEVIAGTHHERWDGTGYPRGLKGEEIPVAARIVTVCDVFDALTSDRPYKRSWTIEDAVAEMEKQSGKMFDPHIVKTFISLLPEMVEITRQFADSKQSLLHLRPNPPDRASRSSPF
ncbi:MAG: response regulator [Nitrospinaceae bacterium]|nr:response regulator [Nitrospinaceae bacterium]NIR53977.1 response regulator [Nitrospinaceae bacterium]NIS84391.1 response regulator [Nitrospinaceae bacterium]NIT83911.1 response regulator [Nitrospinaceae bacterium]NIU43476.1 response regulator [Nitrospinaceae bacterium]